MLLGLPKFILYAHLIVSHHVAVCTKRNRIFSILTIIVISVIIAIITMHYVNGFNRGANVFVKSRVLKIHLCLALRTNLLEL